VRTRSRTNRDADHSDAITSTAKPRQSDAVSLEATPRSTHSFGDVPVSRAPADAQAETIRTEDSDRRNMFGIFPHAEEAVSAAATSVGHPLPTHLQNRFEQSQNADLSGVRIHTGSHSAQANDALSARAYACGNDIYFNEGQYNPQTTEGVHLLAHEVAHTVQHSRASTNHSGTNLEVSQPGDASEVEADHAAEAMYSGDAASVSGQAGLSRQRISRGIATAYSKDEDLKKLPTLRPFTQPDNSFEAMAKAVQSSMKGEEAPSVAAPDSGFAGSVSNLESCRDNAEGSAVYYGTNIPSKWNPFAAGNFNAEYAEDAKEDQKWAVDMLAQVSLAGSATGSWVGLVNSSNKAWADLVKQAKAMCIDVAVKQDENPLAKLADGKDHTKPGDQEINKTDVGGVGMGLGVDAKKLGLKAPDTTSFRKAMQEYSKARTDLIPKQDRIILTLIPTNAQAIKAKQQAATDEKEKWDTIATATDTFEKGLTLAFSAGEIVEGGAMELKTTDEGLEKPKGIDPKDAVEKGHGVLSKGIDIRIKALETQIATYQGVINKYTEVTEAHKMQADVSEYKIALGDLQTKAINLETEQQLLETKFKEFAKSLDDAMIKKGQAPKGSDNNAQAAALFVALRTASTMTDGAAEGLSGEGPSSLVGLYGELSKRAGERNTDQTGGDGRRDPRSAVFGIETKRWATASAAIGTIRDELGRRKGQFAGLEGEFLAQFANASQGTDSIK
jgi:hypothetical protein